MDESAEDGSSVNWHLCGSHEFRRGIARTKVASADATIQ
jgi:hypothetical protein